MSQIKFRRDTTFRNLLFTPDSFAHPAKMDAQLLIWIVERYTKVGETILDPMGGQGTTMLACTIGRNVVLVELEAKFCDMSEANWQKVRMMPQLGYDIGSCQILQGDARNLEGLVDGIITSPPYAESKEIHDIDFLRNTAGDASERVRTGKAKGHFFTKEARERALLKKEQGLIDNPNNISSLPYGSIDSVITSPPYEGSDVSQTHMTSNKRGDPNNPEYRPSWKQKLAEGYAETKRPYHEVDSIITSPPYEGTTGEGKEIGSEGHAVGAFHYGNNAAQIGNLKGDTYLSAMLQVYSQCFKVLKPQGLMILVTKNFIRNKKEVKLDEDTIKLCNEAGFQFVERHHRKLPAQSFWRVIYQQKYPEAPILDKEDILVFRKDSIGMSNGD